MGVGAKCGDCPMACSCQPERIHCRENLKNKDDLTSKCQLVSARGHLEDSSMVL